MSLLENTDDSMVFSDARHKVEIAVERYYPLNLTIGVTDYDGQKRALAILEEAFDPEMTHAIRARMNALTLERSLNEKSFAQMLQDGSLEEYVSTAVELALGFLLAHRSQVFDMSDDARNQYAAQRKDTLTRLGLKSLIK